MKKVLTVLIFLMTFSFNFVEAEAFDITSNNVILYNLNDNNVLYEKSSNEKVQIASLTKIMTTIVALENIDNLDSEIVINSEVFNDIKEYAQAGLKVGDKVTYRDLLYGVMLPSGADCVNALIFSISKNKDDFIKLMNEKALDLGLKNTKFDNAIGMDSKDNYSTASDLAILLEYALNNETFKTIFTTQEYTIKNLNLKLKSTLLTYGKSLDVSNIKGAKSGYTDGAGVCLASIATLNNVDYLLVVLGAEVSNRANAVKDSLLIYDYYDKNYSYRNVIEKGQVLEKINIKWGHEKTYNIKSDKNVSLYLKNNINIDDLVYYYEGVDELNYKIKKGDKLGTVTVLYDDEKLTTYDVYLQDDLKYYHPIIYTIMFIALILMIVSLIQIKNNKKKKKRKNKKRTKKSCKKNIIG